MKDTRFFCEYTKTFWFYAKIFRFFGVPAAPAPQTVLVILGTQLAWCIGMMLLSKLFWRVSLRQITVNGG